MAAWQGGFPGIGYTRPEFRAWLKTQKKPPYKRIVVHMTDAPFMEPPYGPEKRVAALKNYYDNDLNWSGGPDFFCFGASDKVWLGSPLGKSVGCSLWNGNSFHSEAEGKYGTKHDHTSGMGLQVWKTMAWHHAEIIEWMGWEPTAEFIKFHREGMTTHVCPHPKVTKDWYIGLVLEAMGAALPTPELPKVDPKPDSKELVVKWTKTPGDILNFRSSANGPIKGKLPHGTKVKVLGQTEDWSHVESPAGYQGWVSSKFLTEHPTFLETYQPKPAEVPYSVIEEIYEPGKCKWSEDWCLPMMKKVEGLRLKAYPDAPGYAIGYGHNSTSGIAPIPYAAMVLKDEKEAEDILRIDLNDKLHYINTWVKVPLTQGQVDSLCMHIFQQGPTQFRKRVLPTLNTGDHVKVAEIIENMAHANDGVERRRRFEARRYKGERPTTW
jgi:lysozyme